MADNRTEIRVRLTPEGRAILGLDWAILDLTPGFSTRVSKDVNGLSDLNFLLTDGVLAFSVPFSTTNDAAFISLSSPIITDNIDTGIEARIVVDSHELPFDRIWIKQKNDVSSQWEVEVKRSPNHWLELASTKKMCDIDLGTVSLDITSVQDGWDNQFYTDDDYVERWMPTDYGGWVDLSEPNQFTDPPVKGVWLEDLRPWISLPKIMKQGFCEIGWTLQGQILESEFSRALFIYILSREYYTKSKGGLHKIIGQLSIGVFTPNSITAFPIAFNSLQYDPGTNNLEITPGVYAAGIVNNLPFKARYRFIFSGTLENTTGSSTDYGIGIGEVDATSPGNLTGQVLFDFSYSLGASEIRYITIDQELDMEVGQAVVFISGASSSVIIRKGYRVIVEPANKSLVRGDVVPLNRLINCDYILLDLFKGYIHMIGGRIETDWANRTVTIHPYRTSDVFGDSVPGFIQDGETPIDIDGKIICDSIRMSRVKNTLNRYTQLSFADTTDAYIEGLGLPQPALSRKILNGIELQDQIQELKNPFFEPTLEGIPKALKRAKTVFNDKNRPMAYFPRIWDNDLGETSDNGIGERSFVIGPRVLMFYGNISQQDIESGDKARFFFEGGTALSVFGYGSQLPTRPFHTDALPVLNGSVVYGTTESDLYVTFYLGLLQRQKRGVYMDALVLMSSNDYAAWDFRIPFSFKYQGRPVLALGEKISDFAHALDTSTPMRFLVEPSDTKCCDLPCSCRFKECDYYQDFGQYITQETLDDLSVTSFKVNSIERLTVPVDFGIINVVELAGKPFVTNLIDTLNDLAIDYFTFRPSTKDYPDKLDARYFKIKWPACWSFEIIISDSEGEVYKYTDFSQLQQWFDATWTGFGYDSDIDEPQDCVVTIEY